MSVFRNVFLRWCGLCYIFLRCCGKDSPSMSPSLLYHKPFRNCNAFCKSKKKTNLLCLLTTSFNIARFGHENEVRRKALKPGKKWNPALFGIWNPLCWNPESSTRNPESGIHIMESRIQDCPGFPYMGRFLARLNFGLTNKGFHIWSRISEMLFWPGHFLVQERRLYFKVLIRFSYQNRSPRRTSR